MIIPRASILMCISDLHFKERRGEERGKGEG
jgi:hypothetical protein